MPQNDLITKEFILRQGILHLNHAAVGPWPQRARGAVQEFAEENATVGSTHYGEWLETESRLRDQLRRLLNAPSNDDIALVKNTSEGLSFIAWGLDWHDGDNVVTSNEEFPSNRVVWEALADRGVTLKEADLHGSASPEDALLALVDERTRLLSISAVEYASGLHLDLAYLGEECRRRGVLFCVDAIQAVGALAMDVQAIRADFLVADGHKWMLGPEGLGVFYCNAEIRDELQLTQYGWHMVEDPSDFDRRDWAPARSARRFEPGSLNMLGIHALSASLSVLLEYGMEYVERDVLANSRYLMDRVHDNPRLELITDDREGRYAGIVTFRHTVANHDRLYDYLVEHGAVCAKRGGGIRFSPHFYTDRRVIDRAMSLVADYDAAET